MKKAKRNFAPMPLWVLASDASSKAKLLILALHHHDWDGLRAWPGQDRLAKIMSCSRDTVIQAVKECVKREWLVAVRRVGKTNSYDINIPDMNLDEFEAKIKGVPLSEIPITDGREFLARMSEKPTLTESKGSEQENQESATALPDPPASITPPKKQLSKKQLEILPALPWIKHFKELWENKMKDTWPTETGAVKEILRYQSEGVTFDQFKAKVAAYLAMDSDNYVAQERWGLMVLLRWRWTKIAATTKPTLPPHLQKPESAI